MLNSHKKVFTMLASSALFLASFSGGAVAPAASDRIVNLGDSITDGYTYGQIIIQALKEAGKPVPAIICSGSGGNTAAQMAARVDKTVLVFKPQIVTFSAGTNDALKDVPCETYEKALREIAAKIKAEKSTMILLTPCEIVRLDGKTPEEKEAFGKKIKTRLDEFEAVIRKVASENKFIVAENRALMADAIKSGKNIMVADGIHPNYLGQTLIARSILDAMDCKDVQIPKTFEPKLFPGVIREWKMRVAPLDDKKKPLRIDADTVSRISPDESWQKYSIPEPAPETAVSPEDWNEQIRRNGFTLKLQEKVGKGMLQGVADIQSDKERQVYFQIGGAVSTLWLNGVKIHDQGTVWTGFHAGKERISATLKAGSNRVAVEITGTNFLLSVTDKMIWEDVL
jgi:lysophospholipase L1-like esterase